MAGAAIPGRGKAATAGWKRLRFPLLLLSPALLVLAVILGYPLVRLVVNSFQDFGLRALFTGQHTWIGWQNYVSILTDPQFVPVLVRTIIFSGGLCVACLVIGALFSELMTHVGRVARTALSIVLVLAWALPTVSSTLVWNWLFQPVYGVFNWMITQLHVFGDFTQHVWTDKPLQAFAIVFILITWQSVPFVALTVYAAQSQIPRTYYEAAKLDGANGWLVYRNVTIPFIRPVLYLVTVLQIIWHFNTFNQLWILTKGGPNNQTATLPIWSFTTAFASNSFGEGSAIAIVTALILVVLALFYVRRLTGGGELE